MDEVLKSQFHPWHDFIPHCPDLSLNSKQQVRIQFSFTVLLNHLKLVGSLTAKKAQLIRSASGCIGFMILLNTCMIG